MKQMPPSENILTNMGANISSSLATITLAVMEIYSPCLPRLSPLGVKPTQTC